MVVYLDRVLGINFLVDWLLLLGVNQLAGFPPGPGRTAAAAAVGSGYAGMCLIPGFAFLAQTLWRAVSLGIMSLAAFGLNRSAVQRGLLFVLLSMALGGLALSTGSGCTAELAGCTVLLTMLCRTGFRGPVLRQKRVPVRLCHGGITLDLLALCDTGNALTDPMTGEAVLVADRTAGARLLGLAPEDFAKPEETLLRRPQLHLRLMHYGTVGSAGGLMLAVRCDSVTVNGRRTGGLVAFAPVCFGDGTYQALTGGYDG